MKPSNRKSPAAKNDILHLDITGMTAEGNGVGRAEHMAVFVPNTAIGDHACVRIIKTAKTYAIGKLLSLPRPSADRIDLDCPYFLQCGGCAFRHISYPAELQIKEQRVRDALARIGGFDALPLQPILGAAETNHYRNKAQIPVSRAPDGSLTMGFYAYHSHRVVPCEQCLLQPPVFDQAMEIFRGWEQDFPQEVYHEATGQGCLRHLYLREARATGQVMVCVVANASRLDGEEALAERLRAHIPGLASVVLNTNRERTNVILGKTCRTIWGSDTIVDELCGLKFELSPLSFYQVNHDQTERLYALVKEYAGLSGGETVLDLYCGTGTIGLTLAHQAKQLIGVEVVPQAVENAKKNAAFNGIKNARFFCADAAQAAAQLRRDGQLPDVVIVDPPRKGCQPGLIHTIREMEPQTVVYVSCDPATLARDLKLFQESGYQPAAVTPVDLFPRTAHVENVVRMTRVQ